MKSQNPTPFCCVVMDVDSRLDDDAAARLAELWTEELFNRLVEELRASRGTLTNDQLVALYVLSGCNAATLDAALELAASESKRITLHCTKAQWFALVRPGRPLSGAPYLCESCPLRCSCSCADIPFCKHLLAAVLIEAAGQGASEARWIHYNRVSDWIAVRCCILGEVEGNASCFSAPRAEQWRSAHPATNTFGE